MTRDFAKRQLARVGAWWTSWTPTSAAVDEFMRGLRGYTDSEIEAGITRLLDEHLDAAPPKLGHMIAKVRACRPKTYETATEEERELRWGHVPLEIQARDVAELEALAQRVAADEGLRAAYEREMAMLLDTWSAEDRAHGRRILHPTVLRRVIAAADAAVPPPVPATPDPAPPSRLTLMRGSAA